MTSASVTESALDSLGSALERDGYAVIEGLLARDELRFARDELPALDTQTIAVEMAAGSTMIYRGSLWHGGGANTTERPRAGVVLHYGLSWLRPVENHVLSVPRDVVRRLAPRLRELVGYNICPPFVGYVDGRHPRRLLEDGS